MAERADPTRRYVFLASNAYSGSTLLCYLLAAHPRIATVSDVSGTRRTPQMDTFRCSCGERMVACSFWDALASRAHETGLDLDLADFGLGFDRAPRRWMSRIQARSLRWSFLEDARDAALAPLGAARRMRDVGKRTWALANAVMDVADADVFVDASKERMRIRYLERHLPAPLWVLHLVRDVRGVVDSTTRRAKVDLTPVQIARSWAQTNASIERQLTELPAERALQVRYEDLCSDVNATMRSVYEFCGVDPDAPLRAIGDETHMLGNRMRLDRPGEVRLDERWRESLSGVVERDVISAAGGIFAGLYPDMRATDHGSRS